MKNYLYTFEIKERNGKELSWQEYTENEQAHCAYIDVDLRNALVDANCGWDGLKYKVIEYPGGIRVPYMVLYVGKNPERWIPVEGNSRGANLQALGRNIW